MTFLCLGGDLGTRTLTANYGGLPLVLENSLSIPFFELHPRKKYKIYYFDLMDLNFVGRKLFRPLPT